MTGIILGKATPFKKLEGDNDIIDVYKIELKSVKLFALSNTMSALAFHVIFNILNPYNEETNAGSKIPFLIQNPFMYSSNTDKLRVALAGEIENIENRIKYEQLISGQTIELTETLSRIDLVNLTRENDGIIVDIEIYDGLGNKVKVEIV